MKSNNIDLSYLYEITGGNKGVIHEMISLFLVETPKQFALLREHTAKEDWKKVGLEAHKLKPTFLYVGLNNFYNEAEELEKSAKEERDLDQVSAKIDELEKGFLSVHDALVEKKNELS